MTKQEINQAIAQSLGWKKNQSGAAQWWETPQGEMITVMVCDSHTAMHHVKMSLSEDQLGAMLDHLCDIVRRDKQANSGPMTSIIQAFRATAIQEAEAYLRTKNIWK